MSAERSPRAASSDTASARVGQRAASKVCLVESSEGRDVVDARRERRFPGAIVNLLPVSRREADVADGDEQVVGHSQPFSR